MSRTFPSIKTRDFARRLIACEALSAGDYEANVPAAFRVSEKLRRPLSNLAGTAGFRALLGRSLSLAKMASDSLSAVQIQPDGSLDGQIGLQDGDAEEGGAMLIAHVLSLLITFIGEPLTERLVHDVWPGVPADNPSSGEKQNQHDPTT